MSGKKKQLPPMPSTESLEAELARVQYNRRFRQTLRSTVSTLITVAAVAVLVATLWMPVLQISGSSMTPTLASGDIVLCRKTENFERGDLIAFYYNNNILVKRVVAMAGEWVNIDADGNIYINDVRYEEPYLTETALGECDIELPYQVPDGRVFVLGDHRSVSVDSRSKSIGCVGQEQIVGTLSFRIWPLKGLGPT